MIHNFNSFDEDLILESIINESVLYFSPVVRELLVKINKTVPNKIAERLISMECTDTDQDITFIDLDKEGYLSFTTMEKAVKCTDFDLQNQINSNVSDYLWVKDVEQQDKSPGIWKKGRNQVRIGKFINKLLNNKYKPKEIEEFVNLFKSYIKKASEVIKIVSGEEIRKWYNEKNYKSEFGSLGNSCMRLTRCQPYLDIYVKNPDVCQLLIMTVENKLVARALVWKLDSIVDYRGSDLSGIEYFMDRIYTAEDYQVNSMIDFANERGWCYKVKESFCYNTKNIFYNRKHYEADMSVVIDKIKYNNYPYMDTFKRYDYKKGILYNDERRDVRGYTLVSVNGEYRINKIGIIKKFKDFFNND